MKAGEAADGASFDVDHEEVASEVGIAEIGQEHRRSRRPRVGRIELQPLGSSDDGLVPGPRPRAAAHHDDLPHVGSEHGLFRIRRIVAGERSYQRMPRRCPGAEQAHVIELEMHPSRWRGLERRPAGPKRREQEPAAIRRPRLGLVDTECGADDPHVGEMRFLVSGGNEVGEHHLPSLAAVGQRMRLGSGPHDVATVG